MSAFILLYKYRVNIHCFGQYVAPDYQLYKTNDACSLVSARLEQGCCWWHQYGGANRLVYL